jgi:hypothetical protein
MKYFILSLCLIMPFLGYTQENKMDYSVQVSNFGFNARVYFQNYSSSNLNCYGNVYLRLSSGRSVSRYISAHVYRRSTYSVSVRPRLNQFERITSAFHNIRCYFR